MESGAGDQASMVDLDALRTQFYRDLDATGFDRSLADLDGAVRSHLELARQRATHQVNVRVIRPLGAPDGWTAEGHTLLEIVVDDLPFLVDSISAHLIAHGHTLHRVIHPLLVVERDADGTLTAVRPDLDPRGFPPAAGRARESWMQFELDGIGDAEAAQRLTAAIEEVIGSVRAVVNDWGAMEARARQIVNELTMSPPPVPEARVTETRELLQWLADDHFTFLGFREYRLTADNEGRVALAPVLGSSLGLMRDERGGVSLRVLPPAAARRAADPELLIVTKANSLSPVHHRAHFDYVGIKTFDIAGRVTGERRFLGLLSTAAYAESIRRIPVLRVKTEAVVHQLGYHPDSHNAKTVLDVLEGLPRDELFQASIAELARIAHGVLHLRERRELRLFARRDVYDRFVSFLVFVPRDAFSIRNQRRIEEILAAAVGGRAEVESTTSLTSSQLARIHAVVRPSTDHEIAVSESDVQVLERRIADATRSWQAAFADEVRRRDLADPQAVLSLGAGFSEAYKEDFDPAAGVDDVLRLLQVTEGQHLSVDVTSVDATTMRLKVFRVGEPLTLSGNLPWLTSLGVEVTDERPYAMKLGPHAAWIYDFGLHHPRSTTDTDRAHIAESFVASWEGRTEIDGFNQLMIVAGLDWRQVGVLRAYAAYLRQVSFPYTPAHIEATLRAHASTARLLVELFEARFAPVAGVEEPRAFDVDAGDRAATIARVDAALVAEIDAIVSLDEDRIVRAFRSLITGTTRTNAFRTDAAGRHADHVALKVAPQLLVEFPEPRPWAEIFCHSPRVEGVHLRFGRIARGGLRWSDRKEDFRTEVLGLVRAQMVKNTVIVPVGSKGGFFPKQLPSASDRAAWVAEGRASYRIFIESLLDVTDTIIDGRIVHPTGVTCWDGDDPYLVVAADKGTAAFSDVANEVSLSRGYWLGDAFASGGSTGYDHKAMGITARGAWVSTMMHFRELGVDCQREPFTAVGIGDMSGDVFGNGMLQSQHVRLVAAFDHRHVFVDPDPDPQTSFIERQRLADLPGSSWDDYDRSLVSAGGGVFSRTVKSVEVSAEMRRALGLTDDVEHMSPIDLVRAVLAAPVDLLFNGGIGTYVKGHHESHEDVGDKTNNPVRVDGRDLRCRIVVEGGNLGLTQVGRIEYALRGGPDGTGGVVNTDFIDNSAGVDTSDHEVNLKILLDRVVAGGRLDLPSRNRLLAQMTDEVARLVLDDNREQNLALTDEVATAFPMVSAHVAWMRQLAARGVMDPELERLPGDEEIERRQARRWGLTRPELAVLMAWSKIDLAETLGAGDIARDPWFAHLAHDYFPAQVREAYREEIGQHRLVDQIIVTGIVNALVNRSGFTFVPTLMAETGLDVVDLVRVEAAAAAIAGTDDLRDQIESLGTSVPPEVLTGLRLAVRGVTERLSRRLASRQRFTDIADVVDRHRPVAEQVVAAWGRTVSGREREAWTQRIESWTAAGVPRDLAERCASWLQVSVAFGIVETATDRDLDPIVVARILSDVSERLGLDRLGRQIADLPHDDRWAAMARASLREDFAALMVNLVSQVIDGGEGEPQWLVDQWVETMQPVLVKVTQTLRDVWSEEQVDLSRMSVAVRHVRMLLR